MARPTRARCAVALLVMAARPALAASPDDLLHAYPDALAAVDGSDLIWRDGTRMPMSDGLPDKPMEEQIRRGSILDQLRQTYQAGGALPPDPAEDPGRVRNRAFFDKMYGDCRRGQVEKSLVPVVWLPRSWGHTIAITSVNGVNHHLEAVSHELDLLPEAIKKTIYPIGGTYLCRAVADTGQTSMHGWGAAIDINVAASDYWLWHKTTHGLPAYVDRIPAEVVAAFERHGFIWGGRWAHFDTMHFEYRPELLSFNPSHTD